MTGRALVPRRADEIVASRRGERLAARAIAHLPILTDKESAEAQSLFASGSSHHSGNVSSQSWCPPASEHGPVAFFATAWFGQDPVGPGRPSRPLLTSL